MCTFNLTTKQSEIHFRAAETQRDCDCPRGDECCKVITDSRVRCSLRYNRSPFLPLLQLSAELLQDLTRLLVVLQGSFDQCWQLAHLLHLLAKKANIHKYDHSQYTKQTGWVCYTAWLLKHFTFKWKYYWWPICVAWVEQFGVQENNLNCRSPLLHHSPGSWTCSSRPDLCSPQTSPRPAGFPHLGSSPDASSCSQSLNGGPPASSGGAANRNMSV